MKQILWYQKKNKWYCPLRVYVFQFLKTFAEKRDFFVRIEDSLSEKITFHMLPAVKTALEKLI